MIRARRRERQRARGRWGLGYASTSSGHERRCAASTRARGLCAAVLHASGSPLPHRPRRPLLSCPYNFVGPSPTSPHRWGGGAGSSGQARVVVGLGRSSSPERARGRRVAGASNTYRFDAGAVLQATVDLRRKTRDQRVTEIACQRSFFLIENNKDTKNNQT